MLSNSSKDWSAMRACQRMAFLWPTALPYKRIYGMVTIDCIRTRGQSACLIARSASGDSVPLHGFDVCEQRLFVPFGFDVLVDFPRFPLGSITKLVRFQYIVPLYSLWSTSQT
jgi:hypothetical protein